MRTQVIEFAGYSCEINGEHESFIAERNHKPYMEGHHAIPMRLQPQFDKSLDVYANIICLCPVCHRRIHYGLKEDRQQMMMQIYENRSDRLDHCGIRLSKQEFTDLVVNS
jgi:5-methylcytosine-specific restriction protein A